MTTTKTPQPSDEELLKMALDALIPFATPNFAGIGVCEANAAIAAIRARLARTSTPAGVGHGEIEQLRAQNTSLVALYDAVKTLIKAKGRYHTEQNYKALVGLFEAVKRGDDPPVGAKSGNLGHISMLAVIALCNEQRQDKLRKTPDGDYEDGYVDACNDLSNEIYRQMEVQMKGQYHG